MNLIALLIGLAVERLATQLFHLRELRWLDHIIDAGFKQAERFTRLPPLILVIVLVTLIVLPVFALTFILGDMLDKFPYLILAIVVLFFSLGPKDIGEDVDEYCAALEAGDEQRIQNSAKALVEDDVPADSLLRIQRVEQSVFVQANNRLFAVIFWFVAAGPFGPLGAWGYRVTDLVRRRAVFKAARHGDSDDNTKAMRDAAVSLHGWLAWIPARLTALGYAVAGHFDAALGAWRAPAEHGAETQSEYSEHLLARVGAAALALQEEDDEDLSQRGDRGARAAMRLVIRLLLIWAVVIAAMTLYGRIV
jgi:AmpE protein